MKNARMTPSVDFHQHLWPESFVSALSRRDRPPRLRGSVLELAWQPPGEVDLDAHDLDARLELLDRDEIDIAVVSLSTALGIDELPQEEAEELTVSYEEGILEVATGSAGRIVPLAVGRIREGFAGVALPANAIVEPDALAPLLGELQAHGQVVFVHPAPSPGATTSPPWWAEVVDYTAQMQRAYAVWLAEGATRWPDLRIVFAILAGGGPFQLERLRSRGVDTRDALHPNVYFETASYGRRAIELCLSTFGVGNLVYGSDVPVIDSVFTLDAVRGFGEAVSDTLCRENPARLLGI
jgi:predicted TIM-barrel fold metal-dependent hydrolase